MKEFQHYLVLFLVFLFIFSGAKESCAKLIEAESILNQIIENNTSMSQFYLEVKVGVFDPESFFPLDEKIEDKLFPYEIIEKAFFQNIVFIRDELLLIETLDSGGKPLHILIQEIGGKSFAYNFSENRLFSTEDILLPGTFFYTKHISFLKKRLNDLGISPIGVKIEHQDLYNVYQLGSDSENLLVDPDDFKVLEINYQVQILGRYYPIKASFSNWDRKSKRIPQTTTMQINSRIFKEISVVHLEFDRIYQKKNSLLNKYRDLIPPSSSVSLITSYAR
ncbi:hypothetical protein KKA14_08220 [bacterium]|nr:hypothetical protein [bacterium]